MDINLASIAGNLRPAKRYDRETDTPVVDSRRGGPGRVIGVLSVILAAVGL